MLWQYFIQIFNEDVKFEIFSDKLEQDIFFPITFTKIFIIHLKKLKKKLDKRDKKTI